LFGKAENLFLKRLIFWSQHKNNYGISREGRVWIYNTLDDWADQLKVSKKTVQRAIKSLKSLQIIDTDYFSKNKRDRTLFYSVNCGKLQNFINEKTAGCGQSNAVGTLKKVHMNDHMYIGNSKQIINKSNKSQPPAALNILKKNNSEITPPKNTTVQDMIKIFWEEFPSFFFQETLSLKKSQWLVKAFKDKFDSSLKEWKKYLKLIKTSAYIMKEGFKLTLFWIIKFMTIDRLMAGELGVKKDLIAADESESLEKAERHIESLNETSKCKDFRRKILKTLTPSIYVSWFTKIDFFEENDKVKPKFHNRFTEDYITLNFAEIGLNA
jgi:DNA-binding transcriptional regulator YhcF (GntR family)